MARRRQIHYEQWTGCPACHWRPGDGDDTDEAMAAELLRHGISTNHAMGGRLGGYKRQALRDYFDHVAIIVVRHHRPGASRQDALDYERYMIERDRPPFNVQHNPDHDRQQAVRDRIMGEPVSVIARGAVAVDRARRWVRWAAAWLVLSTVGAVALAVAERVL